MKEFFPKQVILSIILAYLSFSANATTLLSPTVNNGGFESGSTGWTFVNSTYNASANANAWIAGTATFNGGSKSMYISNNGSANTYSTSASPSQVSHVYAAVTVPSGETTITLSFSWKNVGESGADYFSVYALPTSTSFSATTSSAGPGSLPPTANRVGGPYNATNAWQTASNITIPAAFAGTTFRLVFTWVSDGSVGTQPPAAIDDITLTSISPCTAPATVSFSAGATSLCVNGTSTYTASAASGTAPITMSYAVASGATIDPSTGAVSSVASNFTVIATATNGCGSANASRAVTVNSLPSVSVTANPGTVCVNNAATLTALPTGGSGSYPASNYVWSSASGGNGLAASTAITATATPTTTGSKTYSVVVTDSNNCSSSAGSGGLTVVGTTVTTTTPATSITQTGATLGGTIQ